jgi:hypothetical protein
MFIIWFEWPWIGIELDDVFVDQSHCEQGRLKFTHFNLDLAILTAVAVMHMQIDRIEFVENSTYTIDITPQICFFNINL